MVNEYSKCGTEINFSDGKVIKKYILMTIKPAYKETVYKHILDYYNCLLSSGILVPKLISHNKELIFVFDFCGKNIVDLMGTAPRGYYSSHQSIFGAILKIIKTAKEKGIYLDPHIKNFTVLKNNVYYVDIFPPYAKDYLQLLLKCNPAYRKKIIENFHLFSPEIIANHFLADFIQTFEEENELVRLLSDKMIKIGLINKLDMDKINKIIEMDQARKKQHDRGNIRFELF